LRKQAALGGRNKKDHHSEDGRRGTSGREKKGNRPKILGVRVAKRKEISAGGWRGRLGRAMGAPAKRKKKLKGHITW